MRKGILEYKHFWSPNGDFDWWWHPVIILKEYNNSWRVWAWRHPLGLSVHKQDDNQKVTPR